MKNKSALCKMVEKVCCDKCKGEYCLLKQIIICSHDDARWLSQLKVLEIFKWIESEKEKHDIGIDEAYLRFVSLGYAKKFAEVYSEDLDPKEIIALIMV